MASVNNQPLMGIRNRHTLRTIQESSLPIAEMYMILLFKDANWWTVWKRKVIKFEKRQQTTAEKNKTTLLYLISLAILTAGASYAAVPLYRMFCSATGYGGTTQAGHDTEKVETMKPKKDRVITIKFTADTAASMQWNFRPQQYSIDVYAGETALAFYTVSLMS